VTQSELNHLRLLLGWVRCEIGQDPEAMRATMKELAPRLGTITIGAQERMVKAYDESRSVPKYVRAAVKALEKRIREPGEVADAEPSLRKLEGGQ
jgi:hypothetical protein